MKNFNSKFSKRDASISTAALPDIIFMLLFFFMVSTILRKPDNNLKYKIPSADQIKEIQQKTLVSEIKIGKPKDTERLGNEPRIEANGQILEICDIVPFILREKEKLSPYDQSQIIILLKADEDVPMGLVSDLQQELRKANARRIVYAATWKK
jgi:biopolymer transport protein ExbD